MIKNIKTDQYIYYHVQGFNHLCAFEKCQIYLTDSQSQN